MAKALQRRRGTTEEHKSFTGLEGEFTYDTTEKRIVVHDGATAGGVPMAKKEEYLGLKNDILEAVGEVRGRGQLDQVTLEGLQRAIAALESRIVEQVGTVVAFASNIVPNGYLLCDGSAVSRTAYAQLFAVIGTTYGSGDGSSTFNVPNLIDRFIHGSASVGEVKEAGLPNITGEVKFAVTASSGATLVSAASGVFSKGGSNTRKSLTPSGNDATATANSLFFDASASSSVYGNGTTVQPPALTMRFCIKY